MEISANQVGRRKLITLDDFIKRTIQSIEQAVSELNENTKDTGITYKLSSEIHFLIPPSATYTESGLSFEISREQENL